MLVGTPDYFDPPPKIPPPQKNNKIKKPTLKSSHQFSNPPKNPGFENFKLKESLHLAYHLTSGVLYKLCPSLSLTVNTLYVKLWHATRATSSAVPACDIG